MKHKASTSKMDLSDLRPGQGFMYNGSTYILVSNIFGRDQYVYALNVGDACIYQFSRCESVNLTKVSLESD